MRLPPLNALRAFEAAARHESFIAAADELNVTPAAISHQIKTLEAFLETDLFRRLPKGVELTSAGRELLPELSHGFAHFSRAVGSVTGGSVKGDLTVAAVPSFATLWLTPRLGGFLQAFPEIRVRVLPGTYFRDLDREESDVHIRFGTGNYPGYNANLLLPDTVFPVCAPFILNQTPLRRFSDLRNHTLLHDVDIGADEPMMTWKRWLRDAGVLAEVPERGVEFGDSIMLTEAAARGQGVALGRMSLVRDHLQTGRLVRPLKGEQPSDYSYYTVTTVAASKRPRVRAFIRWLEEEADKDMRNGGMT